MSENLLFKIALFKALLIFLILINSFRVIINIKTAYKSRLRKHPGSDPNRYRFYITKEVAYYSDRKMKFSSGNKRGDKFQLKPGYISCFIYKKINCYNSRYSKEEQAVFKARYFAARKAEGVKATEINFRSYLVYIKGVDLGSD